MSSRAMPDDQLPSDVDEELNIAISQQARFEAIGFQLNEFGEYRVESATVILYPGSCRSGEEWVAGYEIDIYLPDGAMGLDVPRPDVHISIGAPRPGGSPRCEAER